MIVNRQWRISISARGLERLVSGLADELGIPPESFTVALVSDEQIRRLNRRFRGRPTPTDVLSFPAHAHPQKGLRNGYLGDVVISLESARRQARRLGHSLRTEVGLLMVHGVLHLLGYDHETNQGEMARREYALRRRLQLE